MWFDRGTIIKAKSENDLIEIAEIASNYEVDGIHLDYFRYPFPSSSNKLIPS